MKNQVDVYGVPSDLGANMRGSNMGPAAIRIAKLNNSIRRLGYPVEDKGDIVLPVREQISDGDTKYLSTITSICSDLKNKVYQSRKDGHFPLTIGGDHSIAIGSISGLCQYAADTNEDVGIIWVDAHADMNNPKVSDTQNIHGMPLATVLGEGHPGLVDLACSTYKIKPENVALIGIRDIDGAEKELTKSSGIRFYTMREIDERGMFAITKEVQETIKAPNLHVSFDLDGIDPLYAPGVSTPVTGGISYREAHLLLEILSEEGRVKSADFVEVNPMQDMDNKTASLTVELIQSLLGKSIV